MDKQVTYPRTVREVLNFTRQIWWLRHEEMGTYSPKQTAFLENLFELTRKRKTKTVEECQDIDSTAFLDDAEYQTLLEHAEMLALHPY